MDYFIYKIDYLDRAFIFVLWQYLIRTKMNVSDCAFQANKMLWIGYLHRENTHIVKLA